MNKKIPLTAAKERKMYTAFLAAAVVLFVLTSAYTNFNPMTLVRNGDAFWTFITEDFLFQKQVKYRAYFPVFL